MDSKRLQRIERQIQKDLGEIFLLQTKQMAGVIVSVSRVRVSPDLSLAKAYLSIFPPAQSHGIIHAIQENVKSIRYELGQRVKMQLRKIPDLTFYLDDTLDYLEKIDHLLKG